MKITSIKLDSNTPGLYQGLVSTSTPSISWQFEGNEKEWMQYAYQIRIRYESGKEFNTVEPVISANSNNIPWPDSPLKSGEEFEISVRVSDKKNATTFSDWSNPIKAQVGILAKDPWPAKFIAMEDQLKVEDQRPPETLFQKTFAISENIKSAKLFSTAAGVYEIEINGQKISDDFLKPGWTTYEKRILHQYYDVSDYIISGQNCIGGRVGAGWYSGHIGMDGGISNIYGYKRQLSLQLIVKYEDGTETSIVTDSSWKCNNGPITSAELYHGELYDATKEIVNWSKPSCDLTDWKNVEACDIPSETIEPQSFPHVRCIKLLKPRELIKTPSGKTILDFGENASGFIKFTNIVAPRGHNVILKHAEVLENGELGTRPLKLAKATDSYIFKGDDEGETYYPHFTYHGFRYCQVENWPCDLDLDSFEFIVISTNMKQIGTFECDNKLLNQLHDNVIRSARSNFINIPTDCPQRDERLGWTADIALFGPTALYLFDCESFLGSWLHDLWNEQVLRNMLPPVTVPDHCKYNGHFWDSVFCAIWQDCSVLLPKALYDSTGGKQILEDQFESMDKWIEFIPKAEGKMLWSSESSIVQLGDWLDPSAPPEDPIKAMTDPTLVADAFLYRILSYVYEISSVLNRESHRTKYKTMMNQCKADFQEKYILKSGEMVIDTQTAYALSICFGLYDEPKKMTHAGDRLSKIVKAAEYKIATGFAGTPYITRALALTGHLDDAYAMLLQSECPSWLYPITMGATTIWERWDSMRPDGSINPGEMTSFNHFALGSVITFLHEIVAGISSLKPGYKEFKIRPQPGGGLKKCKLTHVSPYGEIVVEWEIIDNSFNLFVKVPLNTTAEIVLPHGTEKVGSGAYNFTCNISDLN